MTTHWENYHRTWRRLGPPLRPTAETVAAFRRALAGPDGRVLLLGVTPELAGLGRELVAVDNSAGMIGGVWPGDSARRHAVQGDWRALPVASRSMSAVAGDGTLSCLHLPGDAARLLDETARVLRPGGKLAVRAFCAPEPAETLDDVARAAWDGTAESFHALKWRVAMASLNGPDDPTACVADILRRFNEAFPDRDALARHTGWHRDDIATIDVYAGSEDVYSFASIGESAARIATHFADVQVLDSGNYPLSERCPLIVATAA